MSRFICALHAPDAAPLAFALVENRAADRVPDPPAYIVRHLEALGGDDPTGRVLSFLASDEQWAGRTIFVTTGGQKSADTLHKVGPSAVAVALVGDGQSGATDAHTAPAGSLIDTFVRLYRDGSVELPGALDGGSEALAALYRAADLEAVADDGERDADDYTLDADVDGEEGPAPAEVSQSGGSKGLSTEEVEGRAEGREAMVLAAEYAEAPRLGHVASGGETERPDLGEHGDSALALALAIWYGELSADELPATDKADEALANPATDSPVVNRRA